jgi:hypothetical protein
MKKPWHPPSDIPSKRALTEELREQARIDTRLKELTQAYQAASNDGEHDERVRCLLGVLVLCGTFHPLPDWAFKPICDLLAAQLPRQFTRDQIRWLMVKEGKRTLREGKDKGKHKGKTLTWEEAYAYASEKLADMRAAGGEHAMRWSYQKEQQGVRRRRARKKTGLKNS